MSTSNYKKNPNTIRYVAYRYCRDGTWFEGEHVCYEKTDDLAIASCYKTVVPARLATFHITEVRVSE